MKQDQIRDYSNYSQLTDIMCNFTALKIAPFTLRISLFYILVLTLLLSCKKEKTESNVKSSLNKDISISQIDALIEADPNNAELHFERGRQNFLSGNYEKALVDLEKTLRLDSTKSEYYVLLADLFQRSGNLNRAKLTTDAGKVRFPDEIVFHLKGAVIDIYRRKYKDAIISLDQVLMMDGTYAEAYFWKGILFKEIGDTSKSISNFQTCVEQAPDYYDAYMQLGLLHSTKKNNFAESYFENAKKVRPDAIEPIYFKGVYYQNIGEYDKAVKALREVVLQDPRNSKAHFKIGINYYQLDSVPKAYRSFDMAIKVDPQFYEAFYMKGLCAETMGNIDEAMNYYKQTINFDPENALAIAGLKRIENL